MLLSLSRKRAGRQRAIMSAAFLASIVALGVSLSTANAQQRQLEPVEGMRDNSPNVHALINASIILEPGTVIESGTIVLRDGIITDAGASVKPPADARVWDYRGRTIHPAFIDAYTHLGLPKSETRRSSVVESGRSATADKAAGQHHWNTFMHASESALDQFSPDDKDTKAMRALGFGAVLVAPRAGIFRGSSAVVTLSDQPINERVLQDGASQHLAFETGSWRDQTYPTSLMGAIAFIRQSLLDAQWYQNALLAYRKNPSQTPPEESPDLATLAEVSRGGGLVIAEVNDELNFLRVARLAKEFGLKMIIVGNGYEYRMLPQIKATGVPIILPLDFPEAPPVEAPEEALDVALEELQHWDCAPSNPAWLQQHGVTFALTTSGLKKVDQFPKQLRQALERGLSEETALAALTTTPAKLLGLDDRLGTLARGKIANLVVLDGALFGKETKIIDTWVAGKRYEVYEPPVTDVRGKWQFTVAVPNQSERQFTLDLKGRPDKTSGELAQDSITVKLRKIGIDGHRINLVFAGDTLGMPGMIRFSGAVSEEAMSGTGVLADGSEVGWRAQRTAPFVDEKSGRRKTDEPKHDLPALPTEYPHGGFGRSAPPEQPPAILVKNATIWTCGAAGKIENADLLINAGKVTKIGTGLSAPKNALVIDATGKHVTPGLIDAHSHSATSAVNEGAQAVTAEVRIGDVVNSTDIGIYRQLAGGLTTAHVMHGSANPIGGQNQTLKYRWGADPEGLKFVEAKPTIKFALGENVKRSNSSTPSSRYPQTRMGVEQLISDRFKAAQDYERAWQSYNALKTKEGVMPPRRDLELDALVEVLHGERSIHCHSYRQDEILMLIRLAERFGFRVGTFQHVLEGYKVAEAIQAHGAHASTFSDWWAYKFEVYDAIPYNGTMMQKQGVVTSFNSDSGELARRMNLEAAKAVKYGGLSEEEALLLVTSNPARQIGVDQLVGSLEPGKHADFVIWNGSPLSTFSVCEQTWVEGRKYFDRELDLERRQQVIEQREALIQKVLAEASSGKTDKGEAPARTFGRHDSHQQLQSHDHQGICDQEY